MGKYRRSKRLAVKKRNKRDLPAIDDDFQEPLVKAIARFRKLKLRGIPHRRLKKRPIVAPPSSSEEEEEESVTYMQDECAPTEITHCEEESDHTGDEYDSTSESEIQAPMTPSFNRSDYMEAEDEEKDELDDSSSDDELDAMIKQKIHQKNPYYSKIGQDEFSFDFN